MRLMCGVCGTLTTHLPFKWRTSDGSPRWGWDCAPCNLPEGYDLEWSERLLREGK